MRSLALLSLLALAACGGAELPEAPAAVAEVPACVVDGLAVYGSGLSCSVVAERVALARSYLARLGVEFPAVKVRVGAEKDFPGTDAGHSEVARVDGWFSPKTEEIVVGNDLAALVHEALHAHEWVDLGVEDGAHAGWSSEWWFAINAYRGSIK